MTIKSANTLWRFCHIKNLLVFAVHYITIIYPSKGITLASNEKKVLLFIVALLVFCFLFAGKEKTFHSKKSKVLFVFINYRIKTLMY
jgi:hypothetical protein